MKWYKDELTINIILIITLAISISIDLYQLFS